MNNFLSIVWYRVLPSLYGGQKGIAQFNYYLGKKVELTCLCPVNNTTDEYLSYKLMNTLPVSRLQFWNFFLRRRILRYIRQQSFTHIIIEHPYHAWLGKYKQNMGYRFIVHAHNIEYLRMKARRKSWWLFVKRMEQKAFARADYILFKTEDDRTKAIHSLGADPEKSLIIPYGTSETQHPPADLKITGDIRKKHGLAKDEKIILFAGTADYEPNAEAIRRIVNNIIPLLLKNNLAFRLFICGAMPEANLAQLNTIPAVIATGFVTSLKDYYLEADVFINPVLSGSGIQTKNIEAIANGCTIVSTEFASAGLAGYLVNSKVFISPNNDWVDFTSNIIKTLNIKTETPQQFYTDYNWQNIIKHLLDVITPED